MKKILILVVAMTLVMSGVALAKIAGSKHDMTTAGAGSYTGGTKSACAFCHTPHHASTANTTAPLWNRANPSSTYTVYGGTGTTNTTMSGTTVNQPGGNSLSCLSCHDGTIGLGDVLNGVDDTIVGANITGGALSGGVGYFGTDLRREHPVGVAYDSTKTNSLAGLVAIQGSGTNPVVLTTKKWKIYGGGDGTGRVECGSCHDPHNTTNTPFLKDTKGTICTDCHGNK